MKRTLLISAILATAFFAAIPTLRADGCYGCGSGSSANCKDYCRYTGEDTWDNRHKCEAAGCKISSTTSECGASNYVVCSVFHLITSPYELALKSFPKSK